MKQYCYLILCTSLFFYEAANATVVTIGTAASSDNNIPILITAGASTTKYTDFVGIIYSGELTAAGAISGVINSISFYKYTAYGYTAGNLNLSIYMVHTTQFGISTSASWDTQFAADNPTLVYSTTTGSITAVAGWKTFTTNGAFTWNGTDHVKIYLRAYKPSNGPTSFPTWAVNTTMAKPDGAAWTGTASPPGTPAPIARRPQMQLDISTPKVDAGISAVTGPANPFASGGTYNVDVTLNYFNNSFCTTANMTGATINWEVDGVAQVSYSWSGSVAIGASTTATIGSFNFSAQTHTIKAWTSNPNGAGDAVTSNDTAYIVLTCSSAPVADVDWATQSVTIDFDKDCPSSAAMYTFNLSTGNDPNSRICSYSSSGTVGGTVSITFPAGTAFQTLGGTFNGVTLGTITPSGTTLTFNVPGTSPLLVNTNSSITIIIKGILNPPAGSYNFAVNTIKVKNLSGGWDQHSTAAIPITINSCTFSQTAFVVKFDQSAANFRTGSVMQASNGNYFVEGILTSLFLACLDNQGNFLWSNGYTGGDGLSTMVQSTDGNIVLSDGGSWNTYKLFKVDASNGNVMWGSAYTGSTDINAQEIGGIIIRTTDGGYLLGGGANYWHGNVGGEAYLVKTNANGTWQWDKAYVGTGTASSGGMGCIRQTTDGGFVMAGSSTMYAPGYSNSLFVVKANSVGTFQWAKAYGETSRNDWAKDIRQTTDGGYMVLGNSYPGGPTTESTPVLIKINASGTMQWVKKYGGVKREEGVSIVQSTDGNFVILGHTQTYNIGGNLLMDPSLMKTDPNGNVLWARSYGGTTSDYIYGASHQQLALTADGGYFFAYTTAVTGPSAEYITVVKTDANGFTACNQQAFLPSVTDATSLFMTVNATPAEMNGGSPAGALTYTASSLNNYSSVCVPIVLPVEVLSLSGYSRNDMNVLEWITASELNNDYFSVERSDEGDFFESIGKVKGSGNATFPRDYSFTDISHGGKGVVYYRLRQVDFDGNYAYSNIISITRSPDHSITIYPVPARGELVYEIYSDEKSEKEVSVIDLIGSEVLNERIKVVRGRNTFRLDINNLSQGAYIMKINDNCGQRQEKFIKQ